MSTSAWWIRSTILATLLALCVVLGVAAQGQPKEFEIDGTADCGLRSDRRCSIDSVLALWTDDLTGTRQRIEVDVSWIRGDLGGIDQDERVCVILEDRNASRLKAIGVTRNCKWDGTINPGLSTGSKAVREQPNHFSEDDDEKQNALIPPTPTPIGTPGTGTPGSPGAPGAPGVPGPTGTVTGIVSNALTGLPIAGATVRVTGTSLSATTGSDGRFSLGSVPAGSQSLRASASGFITTARTVSVSTNVTSDVSIALTPGRTGGEITIVLTWGSQPRDLDAHLSGPNRSGGRFHIYYANGSEPDPNPYATLDVDDRESSGPETITIARDSTTGNFVAGEYRYWVHNFSTTPEFDVSDAQVTVNSGGSEIGTFDIPGGASGLDIWRVVNLNVDVNGNVSLTPIQSFTTGFDITPFSIPGGQPGPTVK